MRRLIIFVFLSILLSCPAVSGAADSTLDPGKTTMFSYPFFKIPIGGTGTNQDSSITKEKKEGGEPLNDEKKDKKDVLDKKVDDAIKRAWEEK